MPYIKRINSVEANSATLSQELAVIGRSESCDIRITGLTEVSREHCGFRHYEDGTTTVVDLGSKNGTFVNDKRITKETTLQDGDIIRLTRKVEFVYKVHEDISQIEETMMVRPEEATIAEGFQVRPPEPPKDPTKELSEAVNEVERDLENAGFKTLMARFSKQAQNRPRKPKPKEEKEDEESW